MLQQFWQWYIRVPSELDLSDRLYLRAQYGILAIIALHAPLFLVAAISSNIESLVRLFLVAAACVVVAVVLMLRMLFFWLFLKKGQLVRRFGLR